MQKCDQTRRNCFKSEHQGICKNDLFQIFFWFSSSKLLSDQHFREIGSCSTAEKSFQPQQFRKRVYINACEVIYVIEEEQWTCNVVIHDFIIFVMEPPDTLSDFITV